MSPIKNELYVAEPFNMSEESNESPLITKEDSDEELVLHKEQSNSFKRSAIILGLLVGFFIQFSTLGANFLVITIWGDDVVSKSKSDIVTFSLMWSFFTSAMAIVILGFLRNLVTIAFGAVSSPLTDKHESLLEDMVLHMECRFVVGALVGVCMAWTMTDIFLGMKAQIIYSVVTLVVALIWCRIMMHCFTRSSRGDEANNDTIWV